MSAEHDPTISTENNSNAMKHKMNVILGLLAGGAIGAAIGMLFSPHKGTVLRRNIRRKGGAIMDEVAENIEDRAGYLSDTVTEKIQRARKGLISGIGAVWDPFDNG